jgi:predicted RNA methylase
MIDLRLIVRNVYNRAFDRWLRITTMEQVAAEKYPVQAAARLLFTNPNKYAPIDYLLLWASLYYLGLRADDVFFDVGCGAGRSLCFAARYPIRRCVGIEYDDQLAEIARLNVASMRGRKAETEIRVVDAAQADYSNGTVFFFYNPFGEQTMSAVIDALEASIRLQPRSIRIIYALPEYEGPLERCGWLERVASKRFPFVHTTVSFWRNRPAQ